MGELDEGPTCPCCSQIAKRYHRKLNSGCARWLVEAARLTLATGDHWVHTSDVIKALRGKLSGTDGTALLTYYEMVSARRTDEGDRIKGVWQVTPKGWAWIRGELLVPSHCVIYNAVCEGFEGDDVTLGDALREHFDLAELMAARPHQVAAGC